MTSHPE